MNPAVYPWIYLPFGLALPTYYLLGSLGAIAGLFFFTHRVKARELSLKTAMDCFILGSLASFVGARLYHVFFEEPSYYLESPIRVLEIARGGFVFYGGMAAGFFAIVLYLRARRQPLLAWLDTLAPAIALAYAIGRMGCFFNGCCFGKEWPNGLCLLYPTTVFISAWEIAAVFAILLIEKFAWLKASGQVFFLWLGWHSIGRIIMENYRADFRGPELFGLSQATVISSLLLAISALGVLSARRTAHHRF